MEYKVDYKGYEFIITQNEDGSFNIPDEIKDIEPFGTAVKPANEPICVARKPLSEKSVAENVLKWGTGGINVDGCRVGNEIMKEQIRNNDGGMFMNKNKAILPEHEGRFPANLILECICDEVIKGKKGEVKSTNRVRKGEAAGGLDINENKKSSEGIDNYNDKGDTHTNPNCPCYLLDEQTGVSKSSPNKWEGDNNAAIYGKYEKGIRQSTFSDKCGASRFFYQAKVSKSERNMGLDGFDSKLQSAAEFRPSYMEKALKGEDGNPYGRYTPTKNTHPTVKPVNLMTYLCRLITPQGGIVLDPFTGSGSTGIAARLEGFDFIGMEMDEDYFKIAESRIENFEKYRKFIK